MARKDPEEDNSPLNENDNPNQKYLKSLMTVIRRSLAPRLIMAIAIKDQRILEYPGCHWEDPTDPERRQLVLRIWPW